MNEKEEKKFKDFTIRIGNYTWQVQFVPKDLLGDYEGVTHHNLFVIQVRDDLPVMATRLTLIHEIIHALLGTQGRCYQKEFTNEDVCEFIAYRFEEIKACIEVIDRELGL